MKITNDDVSGNKVKRFWKRPVIVFINWLINYFQLQVETSNKSSAFTDMLSNVHYPCLENKGLV